MHNESFSYLREKVSLFRLFHLSPIYYICYFYRIADIIWVLREYECATSYKLCRRCLKCEANACERCPYWRDY